MREPRVGVRTQAVVNVERQYRNAERCALVHGRMEKHARITPAAVGDGDDARVAAALRARVSALWCR